MTSAMATIERSVAKKKGIVMGEAILVTKSGEIIFVDSGEEYAYSKGDVLLAFDRSKVLPKYLYYYMQNLKNTAPEDFAAIYK